MDRIAALSAFRSDVSAVPVLVPTEMLRDEAVAVWQDQLPAVDAEARRLIGLMLGGHRIGSLR